jgi:hypothetical protein
MTKDDILRMAVQCHLLTTGNREGIYADSLEAFANLVAAHEQKRCIGIIYGQCVSDNVAQRTVDAIRSKQND